MVFSSIIFLLYFLPVFLLIYFFTPKSLKNYLILGFSTLFYAWGEPFFVFILFGSTIIDFYLVKEMDISEGRKKKQLLAFSIILNLGLLVYFKYANFFIENVNSVLEGIGFTSIYWTKALLPIGISFYTFQTLTYSIDVYRKVHKPLEKVTDYLLYITMFPQLVAGPIVRYNEIAGQLTNREENGEQRALGFYRFMIGLAKKVLLGNVMAEYAKELMSLNDLTALDSGAAWVGITCYAFHIYFDFSGYSDMAIGLGKMMGFKFPENFNNPYISKSITEFWRRWHITLGTWMRDYLYIPLGGNKVDKKSRLFFNLIFVFLISGLWHGASWNFVIWGAFHGTFLILDRLFLGNVLKKIGSIPATIFTFILVLIGWVFFEVKEFSDAILYIKTMFSFSFNEMEVFHNKEFTFTIITCAFFSVITAFTFGKKVENSVFTNSMSVKGMLIMSVVSFVLLLLSVSYITSNGFNPFIYERF